MWGLNGYTTAALMPVGKFLDPTPSPLQPGSQCLQSAPPKYRQMVKSPAVFRPAGMPLHHLTEKLHTLNTTLCKKRFQHLLQQQKRRRKGFDRFIVSRFEDNQRFSPLHTQIHHNRLIIKIILINQSLIPCAGLLKNCRIKAALGIVRMNRRALLRLPAGTFQCAITDHRLRHNLRSC